MVSDLVKILTHEEMETQRNQILQRYQKNYFGKLNFLVREGHLSSKTAFDYQSTIRLFKDNERATSSTLIFYAWIDMISSYEKTIDETYLALGKLSKIKGKIVSSFLL